MAVIKKKQKQHICLVKWKNRIAKAVARNYFTDNDEDLATSWDLCAVGEGKQQLNKSIVENAFSFNYDFGQVAPKDKKLETLGMRFANHVTNNKFTLASKTLAAIEKRLNELYVLV